MKYITAALLIIAGIVAPDTAASANLAAVPEQFRESNEDSTYAISYDDLTAVLKTVVVDVGRSNRRIPQQQEDVTGTRMKVKISRTANEGNRFYFETFEDDEASRAFLLDIQKSLEALPSEVPLKHFSRKEQLAYWLNLYNVTVLNQVIEEYPRQNLKKVVSGKRSIFDEKLLTVDGVKLSLNDIQFTILKNNYDNDPLVIYGLYQGIVGGPNIRERAYTGENVYRALKDNAEEFINSNRGTYARDERVFRVSSFYDRSAAFFPDFRKDLTAHLLEHVEGKEHGFLQAAGKFKADINDWNVTDLGGSHQRIGGSFATSRAALMDSVKSTVPADGGGVVSTMAGAGSSYMAAKGQRLSRVDPALLVVLKELDDKRLAETQRGASVTIEDLEEDEGETKAAPDADTGEPDDQ